jgi:hypothetical protein
MSIPAALPKRDPPPGVAATTPRGVSLCLLQTHKFVRPSEPPRIRIRLELVQKAIYPQGVPGGGVPCALMGELEEAFPGVWQQGLDLD